MTTTHTTTDTTFTTPRLPKLGRMGRLLAVAALAVPVAGVAIGVTAADGGRSSVTGPASSSPLRDGAAFADAIDRQLAAGTSAMLDEHRFRAMVDDAIRAFETSRSALRDAGDFDAAVAAAVEGSRVGTRSALLDGGAFDRLVHEQLDSAER